MTNGPERVDVIELRLTTYCLMADAVLHAAPAAPGALQSNFRYATTPTRLSDEPKQSVPITLPSS
jgi:hypothetical protein